MLFVAANIGELARRHAQSGSYFIYIGRNFGPFAGAMAGWSMIAAYLFTAVAVCISCAIFLGAVLKSLGLSDLAPPPWAPVTITLLLVWFAGYRDIRLSSRLTLVLEGLSVVVMLLIIAVVVVRHGSFVDPVQLDLARLPLGGVMSGLPFAVFSFVGFESAATLSKETRDPHIAVPRAIMFSAAGVGVFFVAMTYLMILGMGGDTAALAASSAPFADLTARVGLGWVAGVVYASALISGFACALASVNAASRLLFSMGRYNVLQGRLGEVHDHHRTPHIAVTLCCGFTLVACLAMLPLGVIDAFGLAGTFATLGFLVVYLLVCVAAPVDLRRTGGLSLHQGAIAVVGALLVGFVILGSVYPVPEAPANLVPYAFGLYMLVGAAWFGALKLRRPGALAALEHDLEM
jgi:amino acid transporter